MTNEIVEGFKMICSSLKEQGIYVERATVYQAQVIEVGYKTEIIDMLDVFAFCSKVRGAVHASMLKLNLNYNVTDASTLYGADGKPVDGVVTFYIVYGANTFYFKLYMKAGYAHLTVQQKDVES